MFRSFVAIGILTLPYGIKMVGPILGFFILLVIAFIVFMATHLLLEIADDSRFKGSNYEIFGKLLWGKKGQRFIVAQLYLASIATFMGGILFSVDFLDFAFCSHGIESMCHSKKIFMVFAFIITIFIALLESLKPFGYVSVFSTFIIILAIFSITVYNFNFVVNT